MRVLLIEDDTATAQGIELMLKSEGFNVYTTDLGEEGVDLGKLYDYDIILLDLNLQNENWKIPNRKPKRLLKHLLTMRCNILASLTLIKRLRFESKHPNCAKTKLMPFFLRSRMIKELNANVRE